ncbi:glycosyltransferase family 1 protein [Dyella ginsengisoli]|uniref:Glycosyltransferase family 1 protein n=1 Tax=Dyella ginsengisoli TaxID=363848 RepID=A0ABW8JT09_9GAMM
MTVSTSPRVLLVSQWPKIKNAEYELIEKIRQTGFKITVVDYLGFDVATGACINDVALPDNYDFAISFHYDTPKFLNLKTFLWVANPLEFMHFQGNYRTALIHHLRAYDGYLYNGSELLKGHIARVLGSELPDADLRFIGSCSSKAMLPPRGPDAQRAHPDKIFYCGVNWERGSGKSGRAQGLLDVLQDRQLAEFYGPRELAGINPWEGFTSYRGEIPFDGASMFLTMQEYGAVLAVSSPAHLKSKTASGRVFEGLAAGVPVISDENPHIRHQFGDLIYYFSGNSEHERADSIQRAFESIRSDPQEAARRVVEAQALIAREYSFEVCLEQALEHTRYASSSAKSLVADAPSPACAVDIFLVSHDPYGPAVYDGNPFPNLPHVLRAIRELPAGYRVNIHYSCPGFEFEPVSVDGPVKIEWKAFEAPACTAADWRAMKLGEKVSILAPRSSGDFAVFFTQFDYPHYDYFEKTIAWFDASGRDEQAAVHIAGFFVNNFAAPAPPSPAGILRNNASVGLYRWGQDSIAEHQLGQYCFNKKAMVALDFPRLAGFDVLLSTSILLEATDKDVRVYRSRYLLLRVLYGYFHRYHAAHSEAETKGFWALQYDLMSNYTHEINALYDVFHECGAAVAIADRISGHDLPRMPGVDPAVIRVNYVLDRLRPTYRRLRGIWRWVSFSHLRKAS